MATVSGGDKMDEALRRIAEKLGNGAEVHVGFFGTYPDGTPDAEVAAIHNFGAPAAGIPARPFFSNMIAEKSPQWGDQFEKVLVAAEYNIGLALGRMGDGIAGQLAESITDTNNPPLKPETIRRKGGTDTAAKPLVDTGHLRMSIGKELVIE